MARDNPPPPRAGKTYAKVLDEATSAARAAVGQMGFKWELWQYHAALAHGVQRRTRRPRTAPAVRIKVMPPPHSPPPPPPPAPLPFSGVYYATTMPGAKNW
eukprot:4026063-Prymnesium_polylepis.1